MAVLQNCISGQAKHYLFFQNIHSHNKLTKKYIESSASCYYVYLLKLQGKECPTFQGLTTKSPANHCNRGLQCILCFNKRNNRTHRAVKQHMAFTAAEELSAIIWIKNDVALEINSAFEHLTVL